MKICRSPGFHEPGAVRIAKSVETEFKDTIWSTDNSGLLSLDPAVHGSSWNIHILGERSVVNLKASQILILAYHQVFC